MHVYNYYNIITDHKCADPLPVLLSPENNSRFGVYGESNELLNISRVVVIEGAEDPDSKIIMCEVCTPSEECYTSNYISRIIGVPPVITAAPGKVYKNKTSNNS